MLGNGCIPTPVDYDVYGINQHVNFTPWGAPPEHVNGSLSGRGDVIWNLGFVTIDFDADEALARHFEVPFNNGIAGPAKVQFEETY